MKLMAIGLAAALLTAPGCSTNDPKEKISQREAQRSETNKNHRRVMDLLQDWPPVAQAAAIGLMEKFGPPTEIADTRLVWDKTPPFKRSVIYKNDVPHNFPYPHTDVLEQVVDYHVPLAAVDDLARFDGSLDFDRTSGELSSRCDKQEINLIALNLADEIIRRARTVDQARQRFAQAAQSFQVGTPDRYGLKLHFAPPAGAKDMDHELKYFKGMRDEIQAEEARDVDSVQGTLESDNLEL